MGISECFSGVSTPLEQFIWVLRFSVSLQCDFPVTSFLIALTPFFSSGKSKARSRIKIIWIIVQNNCVQLHIKLTMAVVTERTKNNSFASSSATTKMPSGALTLNTGLLVYSLCIYLIRTDHILFDLPVQE